MGYFVRRIDVNKWLAECKCLPSGEAPQYLLRDLSNKDCDISVFEVDDTPGKLEEVLTELALMKDGEPAIINDLNYLVINSTDLDAVGLKVKKTLGQNMRCKNTENYHYDIVCVGARQLAELGTRLYLKDSPYQTVHKPDMINAVKKTYESGNIGQKEMGDKNYRLVTK